MDFSLGDYLITLLRHASSPNRLILNTDRRTGLYLDGYLLSDGDSLTSSEILTSLLEKHSEVDQIMLGIYNLIILDADTRSVQIYNDALGSFPCYYLVLPSRLLISNSLWLLKQYIPLEINEQGFSERFALTYITGGQTLFKQVFRTNPGMCYRFELDYTVRIVEKRLAQTWTHADNPPIHEFLSELINIWQIAVDRSLRHLQPPLGLMLSGGLDSRLVLSSVLSRNVEIIACTHGNLESTEGIIARSICEQLGNRQIVNPMDDSFSFDRLALHEVLQNTDIIFNPIWYSSLQILSALGVKHFTTGMMADATLGGSLFWFPSPRERFKSSMLISFGFTPASHAKPVEFFASQIVNKITRDAKHRLKHYKFLLKPHYQQICDEGVEKLTPQIEKILHNYLQHTTNLGGQQLVERFHTEQRVRHNIFSQELLIRVFGEPLLPTSDRDFLTRLTNISSVLKHDHHLYYPFFRRTCPELSSFDVPNLYGSINAPQLIIELRRAGHKVLRKGHLRDRHWVNFNHWITGSPERLQQYTQEFLNLEAFFDPDAVTQYFGEVQQGTRLLYDGNETLNFLGAACLVS